MTNLIDTTCRKDRGEMLESTKKALTYMGFDFSLMGTIYLRDILINVMSNPSLLHSINTQLMEMIAKTHNNSIRNVDRDVRWAIIKAYSRGVLNLVPCFSSNKVPTTKQLLIWLFDYFID